METHRIAVTVFVEAEGVDRVDAGHIAEAVVRMSLFQQAKHVNRADGGRDLTLSAINRHDRTITVLMHKIMETTTAAANGYLKVEPSNRAYLFKESQ